MSAALDASLRLARMQSRFKGVEVAIALEPGLPRILADEHRGRRRVHAAVPGGGIRLG